MVCTLFFFLIYSVYLIDVVVLTRKRKSLILDNDDETGISGERFGRDVFGLYYYCLNPDCTVKPMYTSPHLGNMRRHCEKCFA